MNQPSIRLTLLGGALAAFSTIAHATSLVFTDFPTFIASVQTGAYTETFSGGSPGPFSGGGFAYSVTVPSPPVYTGSGLIGASNTGDSITIIFTSGNVTAVGGNFFDTDSTDTFLPSPVTITLSDGSTVTYDPSVFGDSFRGFASTDGTIITSLLLSATVPEQYRNIDNLTVGVTAIPEPSAYAVFASLGMLFLASSRRRCG